MTRYDLSQRTCKFALDVYSACKPYKNRNLLKPYIFQLLKSSSSVGANYAEANGAGSKKDFRNKVSIARKEAQESHYWLKLLSETTGKKDKELNRLVTESLELTKILHTIRKNTSV